MRFSFPLLFVVTSACSPTSGPSVDARFIAPTPTSVAAQSVDAQSVDAQSVDARFIAPTPTSVAAQSVDAQSVDARFIAPTPTSVAAQSVDARFIAPTPTPPPTPTTHAVLPTTAQTAGTLYDLELTLEDHHGRPLPLASFAGRPLIISMFYAKCGYACPTLVQDLLNLENQLTEAERRSTRVLLVTFDPEADTPAVLASLAERHGVDTTRWTFARTNPTLADEPTRELAGALGIKYRRLDDGHYNHSTLITLLDRRGVPLARIDGLRQDSTAFRAIVTHATSETATP